MKEFEIAIQAMSAARKQSAQNMRLGDLIKSLETRPEDSWLRFDFCGISPIDVDSYRGFYEDLALVPSEFNQSSDVTVGSFLPTLKRAVGETFEGWKGGDYVMDEKTLLWVAQRGNSNSTAVVGVAWSGDYETIIQTAWVRT